MQAVVHVATDALKMDGDEVMVDIYESVQDELRMKSKQLTKERQKVCTEFRLPCFISGLQSMRAPEFHTVVMLPGS